MRPQLGIVARLVARDSWTLWRVWQGLAEESGQSLKRPESPVDRSDSPAGSVTTLALPREQVSPAVPWRGGKMTNEQRSRQARGPIIAGFTLLGSVASAPLTGKPVESDGTHLLVSASFIIGAVARRRHPPESDSVDWIETWFVVGGGRHSSSCSSSIRRYETARSSNTVESGRFSRDLLTKCGGCPRNRPAP